VSRIEDETALLRKHVGNRMRIHHGPKTVGGVRYHAIIIEEVGLDRHKFGVARTKVLILLPPAYPEVPPIGFYVDFPWSTDDHHFTQVSYYGAPDLRQKPDGYYWYCGGLGGGFSPDAWQRAWRPGRTADRGHNLVTLFVSAQTALNT
jgi:hypothetical protein